MPDGVNSERVLIVDDNRAFRKGLRVVLERESTITVVGEASNGHDALSAVENAAVDVVLMDLDMPGMDGLEATHRLTRSSAHPVPVIVLTAHDDPQHARRAFAAGASGHLLKTHDIPRVIDAIRLAQRGEALLSPRIVSAVVGLAHLPDEAASDPAAQRLSVAERRVVAQLSNGITASEDIASMIGVSVHTVRSHIQSAMRRVGVADRTQLALWGARSFIVDYTTVRE